MTSRATGHEVRYDRTLRVVMWADAFLSVALVVVCVIASPLLATLGVPHSGRFALGVVAIVCAVLLAAFGAITAVVLMVRMGEGQYSLPAGLRLPLPAPMRPPLTGRSAGRQWSTCPAEYPPASRKR